MHPLSAVPSAPAPCCSILLLLVLPPPSSKAGVQQQQAYFAATATPKEAQSQSKQSRFLAFGETKDDDVILLSGVDSMGPKPIIN